MSEPLKRRFSGDRLRLGLGAGVLAASASLPFQLFAQAPVTSADEPPLTEAQPLAETSVAVPFPPQSSDSQSAATQQNGTQQKSVAVSALPTAGPVNPKKERKAEKLYLLGAKSLDEGDSRSAYQAFTSAAALDPANQQYFAAREIARQHLLTQLVQDAEKARLSSHPEDSRQKLEEALALDPKNPVITQHVEELVDDRKTFADRISAKGVDAEGPIELTPADIKKSFHLKGTQQDIVRQVLAAYQLTPVIDTSVTQLPVRLDVEDVGYAEASQMTRMLTGTFFVPLDPKRVLVAKDTKENRQKYERLLVESVYLPGLTTTELTDITNLAKNVFDAPAAVALPTNGILTVRAPESRMKALNATLEELLDGRAQVLLDVRLYDISDIRTTNLGVTLPSQMTVFNVESELNSVIASNQAAINQIISSGLAAAGDYGAILAILIASGQVTSSILTEGFATFGGGISEFGLVPGSVTGTASLTASSARVLDDIQLRVQDAEAGTFRVGTRYPIVTSTVTTGGASGSIPGISSAGLSSVLSSLGVNSSLLGASATIPQIQYQDLGLTLKATPRVQHGASVALNMDLEITALAGSTLDSNPVLNNRKYTATVTLKDGTSAMIVSNLSKQETKAVTGIPGLSELPGLRSTTDDSKNVNMSTLVILVTPRIVRRTHTDVAGREILLPTHQ